MMSSSVRTSLFAMILSALSAGGALGQALQEGFEQAQAGTFPSSWQLLWSGSGAANQYVDGSQAASGSKSLHLQGESCWAAGAYRTLTLPRRVKLTARIKVNQIAGPGCATGRAGFALFNPSAGTWGTSYGGVVLQSDGQFHAGNGAWPYQTGDTAVTAQLGTWNQVEVWMDLDQHTNFVRVNGGALLGPFDIPTSAEPLGVMISASHGDSPQQTVWYDDINVSAWNPSADGRISDFSGHGHSDVLWRHASRGEVWQWQMPATSPLSQTHIGTVSDTDWEIRSTLDMTGDGKADILWRHKTTGMLFLWAMSGTSVSALSYVGTVDPGYDIVGSGDYNGDDTADLLWRHATTGELWVWLMDGATVTSATKLATIPTAYEVVGSADFDGDGKADILWRNGANGEVWIWRMNGAAVSAQTLVGVVADLNFHVAGVGDATGDGMADIVWRHESTGQVWLWQMNGTTLTAASLLGTVGDLSYRIAAMTDYDGDGKADLLWRHEVTGATWVWTLDGAVTPAASWVGSVPDTGYQIVAPR